MVTLAIVLGSGSAFAAPTVIGANEARACIRKALGSKFKHRPVKIVLGAPSSLIGDTTVTFSVAGPGHAALKGIIDVDATSRRKGARRILELRPEPKHPTVAIN
jgi:hypothetical protein